MSREERVLGGNMIVSGSLGSSEVSPEVFDFSRLERVVAELLAEQHRLRGENELLRQELIERDCTVQGLDQRVVLQEQRRTDAVKRIDDLIAQVEGFAVLAGQAAGS
ncbi:MAG: hypothetical protein GY733_07780 [bacterium]|nr:hypothetical protein [bacterium]